MQNSSISISVAEGDFEDQSKSRFRALSRRKRKKHASRGRPDFTRKVLTSVCKWWPALLLLAAAALLLYESVKISGAQMQSPPLQIKSSENVARSNSAPGNLNRLDPITRVVGGVRERCLKLLPNEELELLDIPINMDYTGPIKELVYMTQTDRTIKEGIFNLSSEYSEHTRFNLFTGNQSLEQREQQFKVTEKAEVHCGFYSERGGFRISDEDKRFMQSCKVVVSTCAFGGGDDLYQPIGMSESSLQKVQVCYVAFWDEVTLSTQEAEGNNVDDNHFIGKWRIILVKDLPFSDQRLNGKIPKMLPHRLFPNAKYSIWVDSKSQFRRDPLGVLETLLWRSNHELAISEHGARSSVYDEAKAVIKKNKARPEEVQVQLTQYRRDGLPEDKRFNGKKALAEASIIVRKHTPMTNLLMCAWFNEVVRFTSRDQLSFPYVLWRLKGLTNINTFPVCTRKDLVNSMGHIRKAKPLSN